MGNDLRKNGSSKIHEPLLTPVEAPPNFKSRQAKTVPNVLFHNMFRLALQSLAGQQWFNKLNNATITSRRLTSLPIRVEPAVTCVAPVLPPSQIPEFRLQYSRAEAQRRNTDHVPAPSVPPSPRVQWGPSRET